MYVLHSAGAALLWNLINAMWLSRPLSRKLVSLQKVGFSLAVLEDVSVYPQTEVVLVVTIFSLLVRQCFSRDDHRCLRWSTSCDDLSWWGSSVGVLSPFFVILSSVVRHWSPIKFLAAFISFRRSQFTFLCLEAASGSPFLFFLQCRPKDVFSSFVVVTLPGLLTITPLYSRSTVRVKKSKYKNVCRKYILRDVTVPYAASIPLTTQRTW